MLQKLQTHTQLLCKLFFEDRTVRIKKELENQCTGFLDLWLLWHFLSLTLTGFLFSCLTSRFSFSIHVPWVLWLFPNSTHAVRGEDVHLGSGWPLLDMPVSRENGKEDGRTAKKPWREVQESICEAS